MPWRRRPRTPTPQWVQVAFSRHQPEAEMLASLLAELEIPCLVQRAVDVPDMLAGGPRRILVPADRELEARALLDPFAPIPPEQDV